MARNVAAARSPGFGIENNAETFVSKRLRFYYREVWFWSQGVNFSGGGHREPVD